MYLLFLILLIKKEVRYNWSVAMESAIDSSFFWGYLVTQIPGGFLASAFPANRIFGASIASSSFLNCLVPGALYFDPSLLIIVRVMQGLVEVSDFKNIFIFYLKNELFIYTYTYVQGVTYPACHGIWRFWAPPMERSRLATFAFSGSYAGVVIGLPMSGLLAGYVSWQAPFYFYSVMGLVW